MNINEFNFDSYLKIGKKVSEEKRVEERYMALMKDKKVFNLLFSKANSEGDLIAFDSGCQIVMKNEEVEGRKYDVSKRAYKLDLSYNVSVSSIDEEKHIVYVSHILAKEDDKGKLLVAIKEALQSKEECQLPCRVIKVYSNIILLDIGGLGIPGFIDAKEWSPSYTRDLTKVVRRNEVITIGILRAAELKNAKKKKYFPKITSEVFECSRRMVIKVDPWLGVEDKMHEGDIVRICCVDKIASNYFATVDGFPEINAYCYYPDKDSKLQAVDIILGQTYEGYVKKVDEKERILRVKTFRSAVNS